MGLYRFMVKRAQVVDQMPDSAEDTMAPDKVSPAIVFLCTDEAKDITGPNLVFKEIAAALLRVIDQIRFTQNTEGNSLDTEGEYDDD